MSLAELYDPIDNAPVTQFDDPGDAYSGAIVKWEWADDKYAAPKKIPAITLQLDKPTADGDDYAVIRARSEQMQRVIGEFVERVLVEIRHRFLGPREERVVELLERFHRTGDALRESFPLGRQTPARCEGLQCRKLLREHAHRPASTFSCWRW